MKKYICFANLIFALSNVFAQNCTTVIDFENQTSNANIVFDNSTTYSNPSSNWRANPAGVRFDFAREANGNTFLVAIDEGAKPSWLSNVTDFTGNLLPPNVCSASFCFDIKYLATGGNPNNFINSIFFFNPDSGSDINLANAKAFFQFYNPISVNANSWTNVCIPIERCNGSILPSNSLGRWVSYGNSVNSCIDWNNLVSNVSGIAFVTDVTNINGTKVTSVPGEVWGFDNFCYTQLSCPPTPFPECCNNPLNIEKDESFESQNVNAPDGFNGSDPFSTITHQFKITQNSVIPVTEFRAVVTDLDFNYDLEACADCIDNPALWGSIGGSLYVGNKLTNTDPGNNILKERYNRREIIWKNKDGAVLEQGDTFTVDFALPPLSEIPCCATSVTICVEFSYKDANCKVCTETKCVTIDLRQQDQKVGALDLDVKKKVVANAR